MTVRDDAITITLPGTWFTVTYRKVPDLRDLVPTNVVDDRRVALKKADFLVRASRIGNNKGESLAGSFSETCESLHNPCSVSKYHCGTTDGPFIGQMPSL